MGTVLFRRRVSPLMLVTVITGSPIDTMARFTAKRPCTLSETTTSTIAPLGHGLGVSKTMGTSTDSPGANIFSDPRCSGYAVLVILVGSNVGSGSCFRSPRTKAMSAFALILILSA